MPIQHVPSLTQIQESMSSSAERCGSAPSYGHSGDTQPQCAPSHRHTGTVIAEMTFSSTIILMSAELQQKPLAVWHYFKWRDNIVLTSKSSDGPHRSVHHLAVQRWIDWPTGCICFAVHFCKGCFTGTQWHLHSQSI